MGKGVILIVCIQLNGKNLSLCDHLLEIELNKGSIHGSGTVVTHAVLLFVSNVHALEQCPSKVANCYVMHIPDEW